MYAARSDYDRRGRRSIDRQYRGFCHILLSTRVGHAEIDEQVDIEDESPYGINGRGSQDQSFIDPEPSRQRRKESESLRSFKMRLSGRTQFTKN